MLFGVTDSLDRKSDAALDLVDLDHAGLDLVADLDDVLDLLHMVFAELRDVDETVDVASKADEGAERSDLRDSALDEIADLEALVDEAPWIFFGLLDAERDTLVGLVDRKHDRLDFVALLEDLGGVVDLAGPRHVGNVDHAVDAFLEFDECAVSGEVADRALDGGADRIAKLDLIPWVRIKLTHAERNFLLFDADAEDDRFDLLADVEHIARAGDALDPRKFGNVDEAFDAALDFDERTVGQELGHAALDALTDRVLALDIFPWVIRHLLEAERNTLFLAIDIEDDDVDGLADVKQLGRMVDAAPRHVGDVEKAVHALKVDEGTEVGEVLDRTGDLVADLDGLEELLTKLGALGFDDFAAGKDDVLALVVDLDDFELVDIADVLVEVLRRDDVDLRARKECLDSDIDGEAAFDDALDLAADESAVLEHLDDFFPVLFVGGFLFREDNHALVVFKFLEKDFDLVADFNFLVLEFVGRDGSFGFVADVDEDDLRADFENRALDDRSFAEFAEFGIDQVAQFSVCGCRDGGAHGIVWLGLG